MIRDADQSSFSLLHTTYITTTWLPTPYRSATCSYSLGRCTGILRQRKAVAWSDESVPKVASRVKDRDTRGSNLRALPFWPNSPELSDMPMEDGKD